MHHVVCKVPVVCHEQQPLGIHIESPDGVNAAWYVSDKLGHITAAFFVAHGRDIAARLIQHYVNLISGLGQRLAVHKYGVRHGVGLLAYRGCVSVYFDTPIGDKRLGGAAGHEPRRGYKLLDPLLHLKFFLRKTDSMKAWE